MLQQLALDDPVDQADRIGLLGADRRAAGDHFQRLLDAGDARQALGPAGARQQAELDLGHAELRVGNGDAIMASQAPLRARRQARCRGSRRPPASSNSRSCRPRCGSHGITGGLPNSVMSAPAKKVCPSQRITTALIASSASASSIAATSPCRTAAPSAFTGGLFEVTISTSPWRLVEIGLVVGLSMTSVMSWSVRSFGG